MTNPRFGLTPCAPEKELVATAYEWGDIGFKSVGPRGGVTYFTIPKEALPQLAAIIDDQLEWPHRCRACGRAEEDCSADPCEQVIADREA